MYDRAEYEEERRRLDSLFWHMAEFPFADQRYLIDGFLPESGLVILAGDPKSGKTALASAIAIAVAKGKPFAGMPTKKRGVLWLCLEESHQERSAVMRKARGLKRAPIYITNEKIPIDTDQGITDLQHWAIETDAGLIVVDPLHAAHSGRSLTDGWSARKTLGLLKEFSKTRTILVLHHLAKRGASRVAESVQLSAVATMVMILKTPPPRFSGNEEGAGGWSKGPNKKPQPRIVTLTCMGRGDFANRTWQFVSRGPLNYKPLQGTFAVPAIPGQSNFAVPAIPGSLAAKILETLNPRKGTCAQTIATQLGKSVKTIRNELTALRQMGHISGEKLRYVTYYKLGRAKK